MKFGIELSLQNIQFREHLLSETHLNQDCNNVWSYLPYFLNNLGKIR
jgi:hypothetical protein